MSNELRTELLRLEEAFWKGGASFYAANLTDDSRMVFAPPAGVLDKATTIAAIEQAPRWTSVRFDGEQAIQLSADSVMLIYHARASRDGGGEYETLASSAYVRRDGSWKLAFHQQTPVLG